MAPALPLIIQHKAILNLILDSSLLREALPVCHGVEVRLLHICTPEGIHNNPTVQILGLYQALITHNTYQIMKARTWPRRTF